MFGNTLRQGKQNSSGELKSHQKRQKDYPSQYQNQKQDLDQSNGQTYSINSDISSNIDSSHNDITSSVYLSNLNPKKQSNIFSKKIINLSYNGSLSKVSETRENIENQNEKDSVRKFFGPCKRFQNEKKSLRPAPFYDDTTDDSIFEIKARTNSSSSTYKYRPTALHDNIMDLYDTAISFSDYQENRSPSKSVKNGDKGSPTEKSVKSVIGGISVKNQKNILSEHGNENEKSVIAGNKSVGVKTLSRPDSFMSLYGSLMQSTDKNSKNSHTDRNDTDTYTTLKSKKKNSISGTLDLDSRMEFENLSSSSKSDIFPERQHRHAQKPSNSKNMRGVFTTYEKIESKIDQNLIDNNKEISRENVRKLEENILGEMSGQLGDLRQKMKKYDLSHSGVINFSEFKSAMRQKGIQVPISELHEIFKGSAVDKRGRGRLNDNEVMGNDFRYSDGCALNINDFTEHMQQRAAECSSTISKDEEHFSENSLNYINKNQNNVEQSSEHSLEQQRAMKKVLLASSKHTDPMLVFRGLHMHTDNMTPTGTGSEAVSTSG